MFEWDITFWWCCLNPREREVLRGTIEGLFLTLNVGIPLVVWDAFWLVHPDNGQAVRDAFRATYKLGIDTILVGEPPVPVEVVVSNDYATIVSWMGFLALPASACLDGCEQSTFR